MSEESSGRRGGQWEEEGHQGQEKSGELSRGLQGSSGVGGQEKVILPCMWDYQGSMS